MKTNWKKQNIEKSNSSYINLIEKIERAQNKPTRYSGTIETMLLEFFGKTSKKRYTWKREVFKGLLIHLYNQKCYALLRDYNSVAVLHNICSFGNQTVRNIEEWRRESFDKEQQLSSLIKFSFALYETPVFLENSFFGSDKKHMLWYIQLGKGRSIKSLSQMPITLTSKMAHEFKNAPAFFEANQALRYAQALGFGASIKTAKAIGFSRLSIINKSEEKFWATVVKFFAKEIDLSTNDLDKIIAYLDFKYRDNTYFSMKSRTLKALMFQATEWQKRVYRNEIGEVLSWPTSGITPLYVVQTEKGKRVVYKTVELLNSIELYEEGNAMHHCVAEYDADCKDSSSAIFSLRKEVEGGLTKRLATIEVDLQEKQIFETKAKYNEEPNQKSLELIDLWIKNAQIDKIEEVVYQINDNDTVVNNVRYADDYDTAVVVKVILWILYFILKATLCSK